MVVVATHTPCPRGPWTISLRRGPTPKRVRHKVPNPARRTFRHVSRFGSPSHGVPSPTIRSFQIVSRFGAPLHGVPNPTLRWFRVVSCFTGCPIPELQLCQQQVHCLPRYGCVLLCVSRHCVELLGRSAEESLVPKAAVQTAIPKWSSRLGTRECTKRPPSNPMGKSSKRKVGRQCL